MKTDKRQARVRSRLSPAAPEQAKTAEKGTIAVACLSAWVLPGAGHLWLGRTRKGAAFLVLLPLMFLLGLALQGQLFPFDLSQPLVALAALASVGTGAIYFIATGLGYGAGNVVAATYEYGNTFLIVAGLLNLLIIIDAYDVAMGRK